MRHVVNKSAHQMNAAAANRVYTLQTMAREMSVVPQRLKHQAKMLLVVEVPEKAKAVELVIRISVVKLLEEFQLFQTGLLPVNQNVSHLNHEVLTVT